MLPPIRRKNNTNLSYFVERRLPVAFHREALNKNVRQFHRKFKNRCQHACFGTIYSYFPAQGTSPLIYRRRDGLDQIRWSRKQHERPYFGIPGLVRECRSRWRWRREGFSRCDTQWIKANTNADSFSLLSLSYYLFISLYLFAFQLNQVIGNVLFKYKIKLKIRIKSTRSFD